MINSNITCEIKRGEGPEVGGRAHRLWCRSNTCEGKGRRKEDWAGRASDCSELWESFGQRHVKLQHKDCLEESRARQEWPGRSTPPHLVIGCGCQETALPWLQCCSWRLSANYLLLAGSLLKGELTICMCMNMNMCVYVNDFCFTKLWSFCTDCLVVWIFSTQFMPLSTLTHIIKWFFQIIIH